MNDMILLSNSASSGISAGSVIPLGSAVHGYGKSIRYNGNAVQIYGQGYYDIEASVSMAVTGTDAVTVSLYENGVAIPGATATATPGAAGDIVNVNIPWIYRKGCGCNASVLTLVASAEGTLINAILKVEKEK